MFINQNYFFSILLHLLIIFFLFFIIKLERQTSVYNEVININLKSLKTSKTADINKENNFIKPKEKVKNKKEFDKNLKTLTEIKTSKKEVSKKNKKLNNLEVKKEEKKNVENKYQNIKKKYNNQPEIITQQKNIKKDKSNNSSANVITNKDRKNFNDYNDELKALIQKKASQNYPRISLKKKEEGIVELNFSIDINGNIKNITEGKKTKAPRRLINSSINTLKLISPYKKNPILKKNNTFSIIIVYKLE